MSLLIGVLFAVATVLFVWGSFAERSGHHDHTEAQTRPRSEQAGNGESAAQRASEGGSTESGTEANGETEFRPLGINLESTPLVFAAAGVSFAVAGLVAFRPNRGTLLVVVILGAGFALLEVIEVVHQANQDRTGLVILAVAACVAHAGAAVLATSELFSGRAQLDVVAAT